MSIDDTLADREAYAIAGIFIARVQPLKDHKHAVDVVRFDPDSVVGAAQLPRVASPRRVDPYERGI